MRTRKASDMQLKAISHGEGPARVLAGPGSGKTFTIIQRIHNLITQLHILPNRILCVTFTKAAALEMQQRFIQDFPELSLDYSKQNVNFGTLHSLCYQILKQSGNFYQYTLISESEKINMIKHLLLGEALSQEVDYDMISEVLNAVSKTKNTGQPEVPLFLTEEQFDNVFYSYKSMLKERKKLDFDDMIREAYELLKENQSLRRKWQSLFSHILVDEFQDMNEVQYNIVRLLAEPENNLFIVGDDDQSIYGFRGALPGIMKQFKDDYPDMTELFLTENYRSGEKIIALASKMISENKERLLKHPVPMRKGGRIGIFYKEGRRGEETLLISHLQKLSGEELLSSAIILRTNREVHQYAELLRKNGIPLKGKKKETEDYFHHFIMEDICHFLRFIKEGAKREDFIKFMNKPERYLGRQALIKEIVQEKELLQYYQTSPVMCGKIKEFFAQLQKASEMLPTLAIRYFRQIMGYDLYLEEKTGSRQEKEKWKETAGKIQTLFREMKPGEKVDYFLKRMESQKGSDSASEKEKLTEGVSVITMHGAKGLEFSHVFLPDLNEGVIPGRGCKTPESIEEERRLLYVAITRAKEFLYLYYTGERSRKPTRFLKEILTGKDKII